MHALLVGADHPRQRRAIALITDGAVLAEDRAGTFRATRSAQRDRLQRASALGRLAYGLGLRKHPRDRRNGPRPVQRVSFQTRESIPVLSESSHPFECAEVERAPRCAIGYLVVPIATTHWSMDALG